MDKSAIPLVIGVTGHRTLTDSDKLAPVIVQQLRHIAERFSHSPIILLSPLAEGADRLVAELAMEHVGARLIVPLPMPREEYERDFADETSRQQFRALCDRASFISVVGQNADDPRTQLDEHQRRLAYARTGAYIIENCQILLAIWDGKPSRGLGGTAEVVAWELAGAAPDAVRPPQSPRQLLNTLEAGYVIHIHAHSGIVTQLPAERAQATDHQFSRIDAYNRDVAEFRASHGEGPINQSRHWLTGNPSAFPAIANDPGFGTIADIHAAADALCGDYKRRHGSIFNLIYGLFVVAILMFGLIDWKQNLIWLYVVIFPVIFLLHRFATRRRLEDRALDYRALAEGLRVLAFWRLCNIPRRVSDSYLSKHSGALAWIRQAIANVEILTLTLPRSSQDSVPDALRAASVLWVDAQLGFLASRRRQTARTNRRLIRLSATAFTLTFIVAVFYALSLFAIAHTDAGTRFFSHLLPVGPNALSDEVFDAAGNFFQALMGFLGALGVASEAIRAQKDYDEQERRYILAENLFAKARRRLDQGDCAPDELLGALGVEALFENGEWLWNHRSLSGQMLKG